MNNTSYLFARFDITYEASKLKHKLWWRLMPGKVIDVAWPFGPTEPDHLGNIYNSADPNDHYRPWMEANVGRQCWDWDWDLKIRDGDTRLMIKFRIGKENLATQFLMRWC